VNPRALFELYGDGLVVVHPPAPGGPGAFPHGGAWIHVASSGAVRAFAGKVEIGQGTRTALAMLVAEELGVPLNAVEVTLGDTDQTPWDIGTFGSRSMPDAGQRLRLTAAAAKQLLAAAALSPGQRRLETIDPTQFASQLAPPSSWRLAGRPEGAPNEGDRDAVTGARRYGGDLRRPAMLHGRVLRPPAYGAKLKALDSSAVAAISGAVVVQEGDFAAVAAPDPVRADAALEALRPAWELDPSAPSEREIVAHLRAHPTEGEGFLAATHHAAGDVGAALRSAPIVHAATYTTAYIAHAPLECRSALAEWSSARSVTVWVGTQQPFGVRSEVAQVFGLAEEQVRVIVPPTGSGFGGKHDSQTAIAAARMARAAGRPVRVRWSREEEFEWAYFRPMAVIDVRSGALADGTLVAWDFRNVNSGSAAVMTPYDVPHQRVEHQPAESPLPQGAYRALAATANTFARESHMDELARHVGVDPLELRLKNLRSDDRLRAVLLTVAERFGWSARPRGSGLACGLEKGGRVATAVEVSVLSTGAVEVVRIVTGFECGAIVNADNLRNQIEGATVMGLGGALFEAIHFEAGRVTNPRFSAYRVPKMSDVPPIEVLLIERKDQPPAGAGETPLIAVAPALANAIDDATGRRVRSLPILPHL
jgi:isoquinoline 1-oxidoreductase